MGRLPGEGRDDWFRSPAWDAEEEERFEARLRRARRSNQAQYLRIKGLALTAEGDSHREVGRALLGRVIHDHPDSPGEVAGAHFALGESFAEEGRFAESETELRACLEMEADCHVFHGTELRLAEVLVESDDPRRRLDAWELLDAAEANGLTFRSELWRACVTRVRLLAAAGERDEAAALAEHTLAMLLDDTPRFPRHPTVGLISADPSTIEELRRIARPVSPPRPVNPRRRARRPDTDASAP